MSMNQRNPLSLFFAIGLLALTGCMVGPNYERPVVEVPDIWQEMATAKVTDGEAPLQTWWTVFEDPQLEKLDRSRPSLQSRFAAGHLEDSGIPSAPRRCQRRPSSWCPRNGRSRSRETKREHRCSGGPGRAHELSFPWGSMRPGSSTSSVVFAGISKPQTRGWEPRSKTIGTFW